jgi:hypothetical protein
MATASSLANSGGYDNAYDAIAASATDSALVAGVSGKKVRVVAFMINQGDTTPSAVTFNTKPAGAGSAIFPPLKYAANGGTTVPILEAGYFETNVGEGLSVTTGAGSTTGVVVVYRYVGA